MGSLSSSLIVAEISNGSQPHQTWRADEAQTLSAEIFSSRDSWFSKQLQFEKLSTFLFDFLGIN